MQTTIVATTGDKNTVPIDVTAHLDLGLEDDVQALPYGTVGAEACRVVSYVSRDVRTAMKH